VKLRDQPVKSNVKKVQAVHVQVAENLEQSVVVVVFLGLSQGITVLS